MSTSTALDLDSLDTAEGEPAPAVVETPAPAAPAPAAPPAPPAPPAAPPAAAPEVKPDEPTVPVATLTAERRKLREEVSARDNRIAALEQELQRAKAPPAPEAPKALEFTEDPKGYVDQNVQSQADRIKKLEEQITNEREGRNSMMAQQRALAAIRHQESEFAKTNGDYYDALEHSRNIRREQIKIFAPEADAAAIDAELTRQELATAFGLITSGQNPAERAYAYAKTLGYSPGQAAAMAAADAGKSTPAAPVRGADGKFQAAPAAPALTAEQEADLAARKQAAMSLGAGGGEGLMEAEADLASSGDVFDQARTERFKR